MSAAAIFKFQICNIPNCYEGRTASPCQILLKLLKLWLRYGDFSIFQNGGGRYVGFMKLQISNCGTHYECRIASPCQISPWPVKPLSRYLVLDFSRWWQPPSRIFKILDFLRSERWRRTNCVTVPFCRNRSNHDGDMSVFDFSRWRPPPCRIFEISNF